MLVFNSHEKNILREILSSSKKSDKVLSIDEWLSDSYYSGVFSSHLFPFWRDRLKEVYDGGFREIVVTGSLSSGKSFFSLACWLRLLYLLSFYPDVATVMGLAPGSRLFMIYLSVSMSEAELTGFGEFRRILDSTPYFRKEFRRNPDKNSVLEFSNGVNVISGSDVLHFIGQNLFSIIFDEANFVRKGGGNPGDFKKAWDIYESSRMRIKTRFAGGSSLSGLAILVSSVTHSSSFTEKLISQSDEGTKVISAKVYEVKPSLFSKEKFLFFLGNEEVSPRVIESRIDLSGILGLGEINVLPEKVVSSEEYLNLLPESIRGKFELVPRDFYKECKLFPDRALRDILGISQSLKGTLFRDLSSWKACEDKGLCLGLSHPFSSESLVIGTKTSEGIEDFLDLGKLKSTVKDNGVYIHVDQSLVRDATGLVISHIEKVNGEDYVVVDAIVRIVPPEGDSILLDKIRRFIIYLATNGIKVCKVTFDQYQSASMIQLLNLFGIKSEVLSVDRSDEVYLAVSSLISTGRVVFYRHSFLFDEFFSLIHDRVRRKVDHPSTGSKDVADAFVGSVYNALEVMNKDVVGRGVVDKAMRSIEHILEKDSDRMTSEDITRMFFGDVKIGRVGHGIQSF